LILLGATAGAQSAPPVPVWVREYRDAIRAEYSGQRAYDMVASIEQHFRLPGNRGFNSTIDLLATTLRANGYVNESEAARGTRFTYRIEHRPMHGPAWEPLDAEVSILGRTSPLLRYKTNRNMLAINSFSTPDSGIVAELVYVGGATALDFSRVSVAGKIVLGEGRLAHVFAEAVEKRGALGALSYFMPAYTRPDINVTSIQFTSIPLDTIRRSFGIALSRGAFDSLTAALKGGRVSLRVTTRAQLYASEERTLVAEVRGDKRPAERFVFSAHVQEPGANDNASGVAALAEIARTLAVLIGRGNVSPARTITMLFGNEITETENFLADDSLRTRDVRWGMSLDMVGEDTRKTGGSFLIEKMPDPSAVWTRGDEHHTDWGGSPMQPSQVKPHYYNDFVRLRCLDQAAGSNWSVRTNPYEGGSDHVPFLRFNKPAVLLWHFTDQFYHTDNDRLDKVSPDEIKNSATCALLSALVLTTADGPTARGLVAEIERAALQRFQTELSLSRAAIRTGGDPAQEAAILQAWADYYDGALGRLDEIEVGGSSAKTVQAIGAARARVRSAGAASLARLARQ
jgi:hypothetical protein